MSRRAVVCFAVAVLAASSLQAQTLKGARLDCQVLEVSGPYRGDSKELSRIHYVMIRHKDAAGRKRLSQLLRAESGTEVAFTLADGQTHRAVLRRLRMCFGRGLLVFTEALEVREGEVLTLELPAAKMIGAQNQTATVMPVRNRRDWTRSSVLR